MTRPNFLHLFTAILVGCAAVSARGAEQGGTRRSATEGERGSNWPQFRGDPQNTARGKGSGASGLKLWDFSPGGDMKYPPVIGADGTVFVGANAGDGDRPLGVIYALDGRTGRKKWDVRVPDWINASPAIGPDQRLYVRTYNGTVLVLEAPTGRKIRTFRHSSGQAAVPPALGADGALYLGAFNGGAFVALDAQSGELRWRLAGQWSLQPQCIPAVMADGTVCLAAEEFVERREPQTISYLMALAPRTGEIRWKVPAQGTNAFQAAPAIGSDGTVYCTASGSNAGGDAIYAVDGRSGRLRWIRRMRNSSCVALGQDGTIYVGGGSLQALDGRTGRPNWEIPLRDASAPAVDAAGTIYAGAADHRLHAFDPGSGQEKWVFSTRDEVRYPIVGANGTVYALSGLKSLFAIGSGTHSGPTVAAPIRVAGAPSRLAFVSSGKLVLQSPNGGPVSPAGPAERQRWLAHLRLTKREPDLLSPDGEYQLEWNNEWLHVVRIADGFETAPAGKLLSAISGSPFLTKSNSKFSGWLPDSRHFLITGSEANTHSEYRLRCVVGVDGSVARFNGWMAPSGKQGIVPSRDGKVIDELGFSGPDHNIPTSPSPLRYYVVSVPDKLADYRLSALKKIELRLGGKPFQLDPSSNEVHFSNDGNWATCAKGNQAYLISLESGTVRRLSGSRALFL